MNQSPVSAFMYRQNHQQYSPMTSSTTRPYTPRFQYHGPSPYPRPRSSASKPNPSSAYPSSGECLLGNNDYYMPSSGERALGNNDYYMPSSGERALGNKDYYIPNRNIPFNASSRPQNENMIASNTYLSNNSFMSEDDDSSYVTCPDTSFSARSGSDNNMMTTDYSGPRNYSNNYSGGSTNYQNFNSSFSGSASTPKFNLKMQQQPSVVNTGFDNAQTTNFRKFPMKRKAGPPQPLKRCDLCNLDFTSQIPLDMHLRGTKHMKKIKALETLKTLQTKGHAKPNDSVTNQFRCDACGVTLNGALQLQTHFEGAKHRNKLKELQSKLEATLIAAEAAQQNGGGGGEGGVSLPKIVTSASVTTDAGNEPKPSKLGKFACDVCNLIVNSQIQLEQHLGSKKHQAKVEGKPLNKKRSAKKKVASEDQATTEEVSAEEVKEEVPAAEGEPGETVHGGVLPLSSSFVHKETLN